MTRTIKLSVKVLILASIMYGAFLVGRGLGGRAAKPHTVVTHLMSADAGINGAFGSGNLKMNPQDTNVPPSDIFEQVLDYVQKQYVRSYGGSRQLSNGALSEMLASLNDPHTDFLQPELQQARRAALSGRFKGIGVTFAVTQNSKVDVIVRYLTVLDVMPNSPAEKSGLRTGDHITEIDGHWIITYATGIQEPARGDGDHDEASRHSSADSGEPRSSAGYALTKAVQLLSTGEGQTCQLTVERPGLKAPFHVKLTTQLTEVQPVEFKTLEDRIGYLRIRQFNSAATREFETDISKLSDARAIIVDLRQSPGGVDASSSSGVDGFSASKSLISWLTNGGAVATIEHKPGLREPLMIKPEPGGVHLPMVVLVDGGTANLSEMVASALRECGKAKLIGTHTFGDDVLQMFVTIKSGAGLELSTAHLFTASGADLSGGLQPDIVMGAGEVDTDAALREAVRIVRTGV